MKYKLVLVVDDDQGFRSYISSLLRANGYAVDAVENGEQLFQRLASGAPVPGVILLDVLLPDSDGVEIIRRLKEQGIQVPVIMLSGVGDVRTVVEAMKLGASDFLMKPFDETTLEAAINKVMTAVPEKEAALSATSREAEHADGFVTLNPKMRRLAQIIERVAHTDVPVLITGESGSGKEVMARHAHVHSGRQNKPFIKVNCAALPHELLESELFGYERGAFTGANTDKPGMFEMADGGTLLLDEIGEMTPLLQAKLLHVLQDGTLSRLGARKTIQVDSRIIAATNINIDEFVAKGKFREDLYFRLNVIRIDLPPLRERREDIPALCHYFLSKYREHYKSKSPEFSAALLNEFVRFDWPGNVRQLENYIKRYLVLPQNTALFTDSDGLDVAVTPPNAGSGVEEPLSLLGVGANAAERAEQELVRRILEETRGNKKLAAQRMNICYKALLNKLKRWNADPTSSAAA